MKPASIYALKCPISGAIRYIGKSVDTAARLRAHIHNARIGAPQHSSRWIKSLLDDGLRPLLYVLVVVPAGEPWQPIEQRIIAESIAAGHQLTNITPGGDGGWDYITEPDRNRRTAAIQVLWSPESNLKRAASIRSAWANPTTRAHIISKQKAAASEPRRIEELKKAARSRTAEGEKRRLVAMSVYWEDPANRAKAAERMRLVGKANRQPKTNI